MVSCLVLVASLNIKATAKFSVLELRESAEDLFQWDNYLHSVPVNIGHDQARTLHSYFIIINYIIQTQQAQDENTSDAQT